MARGEAPHFRPELAEAVMSGGGHRLSVAVSVVAATVIACVAIGALFGAGDKMGAKLGFVLLILVAGGAGVLLQPNWVYCSLAFVLGAVPFAMVLGHPMVQILGVAVWGAILTHPIQETRTSWLEIAVAGLVLTSVVSIIVTGHGMRDILEFSKWLLATSIVFALLRLDRSHLRLFGMTFVWAVWLGAVFAIGIFFFDKPARTLDYLAVIGYGRDAVTQTHLRFYEYGDSRVVRLTGTYVDPNGAAIFLLFGFALSVALLRGWPRIMTSSVMLMALIMTLSRGAIFSLLVAVFLYLLFQRMSTGLRLGILTATVASAAAAMTVPRIYERIVTSFSHSDKGTMDRVAALKSYLHDMVGGWWFGLGWGRLEFIDPVVGYRTNYVANSPLLSIYRGGIFLGIAFVLVLVAGAVLAYRNARRSPWESGVIGAVFVGFALVGLQLDFPVVTIAAVTMAWSVLIVLLSANPILPDDPPGPDGEPEDVRQAQPLEAAPAARSIHG